MTTTLEELNPNQYKETRGRSGGVDEGESNPYMSMGGSIVSDTPTRPTDSPDTSDGPDNDAGTRPEQEHPNIDIRTPL